MEQGGKECDKHLHKFMRETHEYGLVSNKNKCTVKQTSIVFFRCVYDVYRAHPGPEKVSAVHRDVGTQDSISTTEVPQIGNLPVTLHTLNLLLHCTPTWAVGEWNKVHLEQLLSGSI